MVRFVIRTTLLRLLIFSVVPIMALICGAVGPLVGILGMVAMDARQLSDTVVVLTVLCTLGGGVVGAWIAHEELKVMEKYPPKVG